MFYAALVPVLVLSLVMIQRLHEMRKHDSVLYRFCEIRRRMMRLLRDRGSSLPADDYSGARLLLHVLNSTIHNYHQEKRRMFDGRGFIRYLREYRTTSETFESLNVLADAELQDLRNETGRAMVDGFFTYTPFLRFEILARAVLFGLSLLAKLGLSRMRTTASVVKSALSTAEQQAQEFGYAQ